MLIAVGLLGVIPFNYLAELFTGLKYVLDLASLQSLEQPVICGLEHWALGRRPRNRGRPGSSLTACRPHFGHGGLMASAAHAAQFS